MAIPSNFQLRDSSGQWWLYTAATDGGWLPTAIAAPLPGIPTVIQMQDGFGQWWLYTPDTDGGLLPTAIDSPFLPTFAPPALAVPGPVSFPISLPASPSSRTIQIGFTKLAALLASPYTASQQVQEWPGEFWDANITLPPMTRDEAEPWLAALLAAHGPVNAFYLGDPNGQQPRGVLGGTPLVNGTHVPGQPTLLTRGWTPSIAQLLKAGDWIQLGAGAEATRIQTSGGSTVIKYFYVFTSPSISGQVYEASVNVRNMGATPVSLVLSLPSFGSVATVAAGQQARLVSTVTGDGVNPLEFLFIAGNVADALNFIAWNPRVRRRYAAENLLPSDQVAFAAWSVEGGATATVTQNVGQRLHKALTDVASDSDGVAEIELVPALRDTAFDGDPVTVSNCKGVFRLADVRRSWDLDQMLRYGCSFQCVEALP